MAESAGKVFLYANGKDITYGIKRYMIDDESVLSELPKDAHVGSSCLVIETGDVYVMNSEGEWKKSIKGGSDGSSSDTTPLDPDVDQIIYDGGEVV